MLKDWFLKWFLVDLRLLSYFWTPVDTSIFLHTISGQGICHGSATMGEGIYAISIALRSMSKCCRAVVLRDNPLCWHSKDVIMLCYRCFIYMIWIYPIFHMLELNSKSSTFLSKSYSPTGKCLGTFFSYLEVLFLFKW